jgi:hypothetical protein
MCRYAGESRPAGKRKHQDNLEPDLRFKYKKKREETMHYHLSTAMSTKATDTCSTGLLPTPVIPRAAVSATGGSSIYAMTLSARPGASHFTHTVPFYPHRIPTRYA